MATEEAVFALKIDADAEPAKESAAALEKFRASVEKSQAAIANYRKSQGLLKGSSDEVADAKKKLKAAIAAESAAITKANLGILKLGGSYDKLSKASKKNTTETISGKKAIATVGGPLKDLVGKFDEMKGMMPALASGWGLLALGVAAGVAALALAAASVAGLTIKFTAWLAETVDANRNLALQREAFAGTTKNATAWGHVMDWAAEKTALTTQQMNELVVSTEKTYRGFRISGQGMVDAFKASAAAAGAGRPDVASFFDEILRRGKLTGRTFVGPQDFAQFRNAGIDVKKLYEELGVSAAMASRGAVVSTDKMAAALRKLSENRFAEINGKKMLSLGFQWDHLTDNFMRFTNDLVGEGGAFEPLLKSIAEVAKMFDLSTDSGQEMKKSVTAYGTTIANFITSHIPDVKAFVGEVIDLGSAFVEGAAAVISFAQSSAGLFVIKSVLAGIAVVAGIVALSFLPIIAALAVIGVAVVAVGAAFYGIYAAAKALIKLDWAGIGSAIVDGIKYGMQAAWGLLKATVMSMGEGIKKAFTSILKIGSPSKVFDGYGGDIGDGAMRGVRRSQPRVEDASASLARGAASEAAAVASEPAAAAPSAPASGQPGGGGGARGPEIKIVFNITGQESQKTATMLQSQSLLDGLTQAVRAALKGGGIPTGIPVASGG